MTVDQFLTFFNEIYCDYDGAYGDQCFDLANGYSRWIGGQRFTGETADLIFGQQLDFYTSIPNAPDNFPQRGDVVVWNWPHVGIATGNNTNANQFEVLEQNDPTGSNCHLKTYDYNGVIGWLRPKQLPQDNLDLQQQLDAKRIECDVNWNMNIALFTALGVNLDPNDKDRSKQEALNKINQMNKQHDQDVQYIADIKKTDSQILDQDGKLAEQLLDAQKATKDVTDDRQLIYNELGVINTPDALQTITALKKPHQDVVDNVQPIIEGLADAAFKKTKSPVVKSNLQKIKDILSKFFSKFKVG